MDGSQSEFYDHSTLYGRVQAIAQRIKWQHFVAFLCLAFGMMFWVAVLSDVKHSDPAPVLEAGTTDASTTQTFIFKGLPGGKSTFSGFLSTTDVSKLTRIEIRNAIIDATKLTTSLNGSTSLKSIHLDVSGVIGHYLRATLPNLSTFEFNWLPNVNADDFKNDTILKEILFFDKVNNENWDFNRDVLNLPVNISVMVDGTKILEVNRATGTINLNIHFCSNILQNAKGPYKRLSLSWCPLTNVSILPPELTYINLNNAMPKPGELPKLQKLLPNLEEFHAFQPQLGYDDQAPPYYYTPDDPYFQTPINLNDFAPTLKKLSVSKLAILATPDYVSNIEDLTLEESNISSVVIDNFVSMFPKLTTIRLFNISGMPGKDDDLRLLANVIKSTALKIVVTEFRWGREEESAVGAEVAEYLRTRGLDFNEPDFQILRNSTNGGERITQAIAKPLSFLERNYKRFESMGFIDIDTYEDYLIYDSVRAIGATSGATLMVVCPLFSLNIAVVMFLVTFLYTTG